MDCMDDKPGRFSTEASAQLPGGRGKLPAQRQLRPLVIQTERFAKKIGEGVPQQVSFLKVYNSIGDFCH